VAEYVEDEIELAGLVDDADVQVEVEDDE